MFWTVRANFSAASAGLKGEEKIVRPLSMMRDLRADFTWRFAVGKRVVITRFVSAYGKSSATPKSACQDHLFQLAAMAQLLGHTVVSEYLSYTHAPEQHQLLS